MSIELITQFKALKLYGMAQCWPEMVARMSHSDLDPERLMRELEQTVARHLRVPGG